MYSNVLLDIPKLLSWLLIGVIGVVLLYIAIVDDTTNGAGDTISHFMFSKYSWQHPSYFLDHWAKPVFTTLSSPFSQFGFVGMRIFNVLMALGTCVMVWKIAGKLDRSIPIFAFLILISIPWFTLKMFSGYTEYLYAFLLTWSILLCLKEQFWKAAIIASFFPFCRSEGIIAIGMFVIYLTWMRQWKILPLLLVGHVFYELFGVGVFDQPWGWTWNKIPYLSGDGGYGSGQWNDFLKGLPYSVQYPILIMLVLGILYKFIACLRPLREYSDKLKADVLLVYGNAVAFFVAHSIFWTFGLFNSFGLGRVTIAIMPLVALMALDGFELIRGIKLKLKWQQVLSVVLICGIVYFPFNRAKGGLTYKRGMNHIPEHDILKNEVQPYLEEHFPDNEIFYNVGYLAIVRDENFFDMKVDSYWFRKVDFENMAVGDVYVWDNKFGGFEAGIDMAEVETDSRYKNHSCFISDTWNGKYTYCIIERISD